MENTSFGPRQESSASSLHVSEREWVSELSGEDTVKKEALIFSKKTEAELKTLLVTAQSKLNRAQKDLVELSALPKNDFIITELTRAEQESKDAQHTIAVIETAQGLKKLTS